MALAAASLLVRVARAARGGGVAVAHGTAETASEDIEVEAVLAVSCSFQAAGAALGSQVWLVPWFAEAVEADTLSETVG